MKLGHERGSSSVLQETSKFDLNEDTVELRAQVHCETCDSKLLNLIFFNIKKKWNQD
jgi:hypothetical protein